MTNILKALRIPILLALAAGVVYAHVGSPDVYLDTKAGPYQLFISVQPPPVIPGIAQLQVRSEWAGVTEIRATPLGMTGPSAQHAPIPEMLHASKDDAQFFTGALWLMESGSLQIRLLVNGRHGQSVVSIPLPAVAQRTTRMQSKLGLLLLGLMGFLVFGLVAISGAAVREAQLDENSAPTKASVRKSRFVMAAVFASLVFVIWLGNSWWNSEARNYSRQIYKPLQMQAALQQGHLLALTLSDPGRFTWRKVDDFIPDHDHLMHLYLVRWPAMDLIFHLHPQMADAGLFRLDLPTLPAGSYKLYADVVHEDGFPETMTAQMDLPTIAGRALAGDDAEGASTPISQGAGTTTSFTLPDGYKMTWFRENGALQAKHPELFRFRLLTPAGTAPADMAFYMGMLGHAAFVKSDGSVFAHIHPNGSVAMSAFMMAQAQNQANADSGTMPGMSMPGITQGQAALANEVPFPYGFPTAGHYRIFVQMKHGSVVETGIFDAQVN
jgi:hypothetical protein